MIMAFNRSPWIVVACIAFALHVSVCQLVIEHGSQVECYNTPEDGCSGTPDLRTSSPRECCLGDGYWYQLGPSGECVQCIVHGFQQTAFVSEEGTSLRIPIHLNQKGNQSISGRQRIIVHVIPKTADSSDYRLRTASSFRLRNSLPHLVEVNLKSDDVALEGNETFQLELEMHLELEVNEFLRNICNITITDETRTTLEFIETDYGSEEGDGNVNIQLWRLDRNLLASDLVLHITPLTFEEARERGISLPSELPASATRQDYGNSPPVEVVLSGSAPGALHALIPISDDEINELEEGFIVILEVASAVNPALVDLSRRNTALCRIRDNDNINIGFQKGEYTFNESDGAVQDTVTLIKDRPTEQTFIVTVIVQLQFRRSYRDATAGKDFTVGTVDHRINLHFEPEINRLAVAFEIFDDAVPEGTEAFQFFSFRRIIRDNPDFDCKIAEGCLTSTLIKINDDDVLTVGFETPEVTVLESDGAVMLCVNITEPANEQIEIEFNLEVLLSETTGVDDFVSLDISLEQFSESLRRQCFNVTILDDSIAEGTEMFAVTLQIAVGESSPQVQINPASTIIEIIDDEYLVGIEHEVYNVSEGDGPLELCAILVRGIPTEPAKIILTTVDGRAAASKDYTSKAEDLVLNSVTTRSCVEIPILNDIVPEIDEDFTVRLTVNDDRAVIATEVATVTISDDDVEPEPEKGCTVEVFVLASMQEEQQMAVVNSVQSAFPGLFGTPLPTDTTTDKPTDPTTTTTNGPTTTPISSTVRKDPVLSMAYTTLAEEYNRVESDNGYTQFVEAVTEITEAYQESCSGPKPELSDVPKLAQQFAALSPTAAQDLRNIFGKMICIRQLYSTGRKRQTPLPLIECPPGGILDPSISVDEFFACLDNDIEMRYRTHLQSCFGFTVDTSFPCLAFVVDTTGSMTREIEAVQNLIQGFISSEENEPACYAIIPFNDMDGDDNQPPRLGEDYGPAGFYDTEHVGDLQNMLNVVNNLRASGGGGDCVEYGMHALQEILRAPHPYYGGVALDTFSQMILITDAGAKDGELQDAVKELAHRQKVCIHLLLSTHGYCPDSFGSYLNVSHETGGTTVWVKPAEIEQLISLFGRFRSPYQGGTSCENFYRNRKKRNSPERCQSFRVSVFTNILKFLITTQQSQATVRSPSGEVTEVSIFSRYGSQTILHPEIGEWSICVESGTLSISFNNQVLLDYVVTFIEEDEQPSTRVASTTNIPPGCSTGRVAVHTSRVSDISSASLNFISNGNIIGSVTLTQCGGAMIGNATFPLGSVTYQLQGEDMGGNPFVHNSRRIYEFNPGNYLLTPSSTNPGELRPGEPVMLTFELHNQNLIAPATFTISSAAPSRFNVVLQETHITLAAGSSTQIGARVTAGSHPPGSTHQVTLRATDGCATVSASQTLTITAPPTSATNECGCTIHGTCVVAVRRGRQSLSCRCDSGYTGRLCDEEY